MRKAYMPVGPGFGHLLYSLARSVKAKTVVEFGTSFGISTIFLASAIRDNGEGKVITTEFDPDKAERAKRNLTAAGLDEWVEFRVGDALKTLSNPPREIDIIFLDGAKELYLDVLKLLEPHLRPLGIIASDNTDHDGMEAFLDYVRNPGNGYTSSAILTAGGHRPRGHEITIRNRLREPEKPRETSSWYHTNDRPHDSSDCIGDVRFTSAHGCNKRTCPD